MTLSPKQDRFCHEYMVDLNATQAAIRAGYSPKSAYQVGSENMRKPQVLNFIQHLTLEANERADLKLDEVLRKLCKIAYDDNQKTGNQIKALGILLRHLTLEGELLARQHDSDEREHVILYLPDNGRNPDVTARLKAEFVIYN